MKIFCEKVKGKVRDDEYSRLLEFFQEYSNGRITMLGLIEMVKDLLEKYPGFFDRFLDVFTPSNDCLIQSTEPAKNSNKRKRPVFEGVGEIDGYNKKISLGSNSAPKRNPESPPRNKTNVHLVQALKFCGKVMEETNSEEYLALLKFLHDYGTGKITMISLKVIIANYFPEFVDDFHYFLEFNGSSTKPSLDSQSKADIDNKGQKTNKKRNIMQLDELTPSYKFLPKRLIGVHSRGTKEADKEVLNSSCKTSKRLKNEPPPVWPRDPDEMMLNEKEDELFERDVLMEWMRSTKNNATDLYKDIKEGKIQKPTAKDVKEKMKSYNMRFMERMYDESGQLVVNQLLHSPETVLPVLIDRLNKMESPSLGT